MCFTPLISLMTAFIELFLAVLIIFIFKKSRIKWFISLFILMLGFYQFTEFGLCSYNSFFWAKLGFAIYTFLPALGLHGVLYYLKKKKNIFLIYSFPIFFSAVAFFSKGFILEASCSDFFVRVINTFFSISGNLMLLFSFFYWIYYWGFIILVCYFLLKDYKKTNIKLRKKTNILIVLSVFLMTVPTIILIAIFPILGIMFPSVLCEFALLLALTAFLSIWFESKMY